MIRAEAITARTRVLRRVWSFNATRSRRAVEDAFRFLGARPAAAHDGGGSADRARHEISLAISALVCAAEPSASLEPERRDGIAVASAQYMGHADLLKAENPEDLSVELRTADDPLMQRRRQVICLSLVSATCMGVVAAYQIGLLKHVPEPPLPMLNADKVDASAEAYGKLSTGDAFLGFVSYGVTMLLAAIGGPRRHETHPAVPIAMAGKALIDAAQAAKLTRHQWTHHRAFCSWCLAAAASTFAVIPAVVPELRAAVRTFGRSRHRPEAQA